MIGEWNSQLGLDRFVALTLAHKREGTYADIGAGLPDSISNTVVLEREYGWRGVLCDLEHFEALRKGRSPKNWIHDDARTLPWHDALAPLVDAEGFIDFLSLDLEPPELTAEVLLQIPLRDFRFRIACVEHDRYRDSPLGDSRAAMMRAMLEWRGYVFVCEVMGNGLAIEDWWVHKDSGLLERVTSIVMPEIRG